MTQDDTPSGCSRKNLAHLAALSAIASFPLLAATNLFLDDTPSLLAAYQAHHALPNRENNRPPSFTVDPDEAIVVTAATKLKPILLAISKGLFEHHAQKDRSCDVSSALKEFLGKLELAEDTEAMEEELDRQDEGLSSSSLEEMFTKIAQKATAKEVQKMKSILRKNSSGGAADQDPEPSNNGTRPSGGPSRRSRGRSSQPSGRSSNHRKRKQGYDDGTNSDGSEDVCKNRGRSRSRSQSRGRNSRNKGQGRKRERSNSRQRQESSHRGKGRRGGNHVRFSKKDNNKAKSDQRRQRNRSRSRHCSQYRQSSDDNNAQGGSRRGAARR